MNSNCSRKTRSSLMQQQTKPLLLSPARNTQVCVSVMCDDTPWEGQLESAESVQANYGIGLELRLDSSNLPHGLGTNSFVARGG